MIRLLDSHATPQQLSEMLEELEDYVKLAVDIEQGIAAGGGALHADCEAALLASGRRQENIWGADWIPRICEVRYESLSARLGNLASNLSRIKSLSNHLAMGEAAGRVVDESILFIEWTVADASLRQQAELAELRRLLTIWRLEWQEIWNNLERRTSVAEQAGAWSEKILDRSGLLNPQDV